MTVVGEGFLEDEREIATFRLNGYELGMSVEGNPDLLLDIAVNEFPPPCADNDTLGNRLRTISIFVKSIVRAFERYFDGTPNVGK